MLGLLYITVFFIGHIGVACLMVIWTCELFREIVNVAHCEVNPAREIPWFRSVLYAWFFVAAYTAYTSGQLKAPLQLSAILSKRVPFFGPNLAWFLDFELYRYHSLISLCLYATALVATVSSLRMEYLAVQLRILSFTGLALSLFLVPLKMAIFNAFAGLFWFVFPFLLVAVNDTFAYFSGLCFGRRIIKRDFLAISPNKTWEGFIGGGALTIIAGFYIPLLLNTPWLTCTYDSIEADGAEKCAPNYIFVQNGEGPLPIQYHGLCLAIFAATVAPFGGFAASGIKRAYGIKDFANIIPGHGGFFDRLDCQFLMALATYVYITTFIFAGEKNSSNRVEEALEIVSGMGDEERALFVAALGL